MEKLNRSRQKLHILCVVGGNGLIHKSCINAILCGKIQHNAIMFNKLKDTLLHLLRHLQIVTREVKREYKHIFYFLCQIFRKCT